MLKQMLQQIAQGKLVESKQNFVSIISEKVQKKLEEAKVSVAQSMFNESNSSKLHPAVEKFAAMEHENWRKKFDPDGSGKERIKDNLDGTSGNINVPFNQLHPYWKKENIAAGHAAKEAVEKYPTDLEKASEHIHNEWMKRNRKETWNAHQHVPYSKLPEDEKDKDRAHAITMREILGKMNESDLQELSTDGVLDRYKNKVMDQSQGNHLIHNQKRKAGFDKAMAKTNPYPYGPKAKVMATGLHTESDDDYSDEESDESFSKHPLNQLQKIASVEPLKDEEKYEYTASGSVNKNSKPWSVNVPPFVHLDGTKTNVSPEDARHLVKMLQGTAIKPDTKEKAFDALHGSKEGFAKVHSALSGKKAAGKSIYGDDVRE